MTFKDALRNCLTVKYCSVQGRASRSEYWWFMLFSSVATAALENIPVVGILASLAFIAPTICVTSRRLHDIGWSGWWQLLPLVLFLASIASVLFDVSGMTFVVLFLGGLGPALELRHRRDFVARPGVGALGALHAFFCHGFTSDVVVGDGLLFGGPVLILVLPGDGRLPPALFHTGALVVRLAVLRHRNHLA